MVSVVIAAYKGEKYIRRQVESVLSQLSENDELIISDDFLQGDTRDAVKDLIENDNRIKYIEGPGKGVIRNFEFAVSKAVGDFIFLCDQDDVWLDGKVKACCDEINSGADVVLHNAEIVDFELKSQGKTAFELNRTKTGFISNLIKNTYQGSCMAFSSNMKKYILPFPENIPMHDQWIGLMGEKHGKVALIDTPYILYRRHDAVLTGNGSTLKQKLMWRANLIRALLGR